MEHDEIHEANVTEDVLIALGDVPISELVENTGTEIEDGELTVDSTPE